MEKEGAQGDVQKKEETPLEKGEDDLMKGTPSTPLEKGYLGMHQPMSLFPKPGEGLSMRQEVEEKNKRKKIMVDYHNTLAINDHITQESSDALESLLEKGHEVIICTWCGRDRVARVRHHLEQMHWWGKVGFMAAHIRKGVGSKASLCIQHGCTIMFDDAGDILQEAVSKGIQVYPIRKTMHWHWWADKAGIPQLKTFVDAAACFHKSQEADL